MSKDVKALRVDTKLNFIKDSEFQHPEITKAECLVAYHGENRNGSFISRETFEKDTVMNSLKGIPVVGEYWEKSDNFKGHGGKLEISDDGIEYVMTTKPYGAVVDPNPRWVEITEEDGTVHEYLAVDVYLWTGRYEELNVVAENGANQSMEIIVKDGEYSEEKDVYDIKDFFYSALCILGKDERNPEFDYEPCFESAGITTYNLDKEGVEQLNEFMKLLKEFTLQEKTEEVVEEEDFVKDKEKDDEYVEDEEEVVEDEETDEEEVVEEDMQLENPIVETETVESEEFELTYNDKRELLLVALRKVYSNAWLMDMSDEFVYYERYDNEVGAYKNFKQSYTMLEDGEISFGEDKVEVFHAWLTAEEKASFEIKDEKIEQLQNELNELNEYKLQKEHDEYIKSVADVFEQFDNNVLLVESEDYSKIKKDAVEQKLDCEIIKKEVFALLGVLTFNTQDSENGVKVFTNKNTEKKEKFAEYKHFADLAKQYKI